MYKRRKHNLTSVALTIFIVSMLVFSGPASAFTLGVSVSDDEINAADSSVVFTVEVDIDANERLPVQNLTLNVSGNVDKLCKFYPNGSAISGCDNLAITAINTGAGGYGYGYRFGYGYGFDTSWSTSNFTFDYGYGYGYVSGYGTGSGELKYNITWTFNTSEPADGNYTASLKAEAGSVTFKSATDATFTVDRTYPTRSVSVTPSEIYAGDSVLISCSSSDDSGIASTSLTVEDPAGTAVSASCGASFSSTSEAGTYTVTYSATDNKGNTASTSTSFIALSKSAGGSDTTATVPPTQGQTWIEATPDVPLVMTITEEDIPFEEITLEVNTKATDVRISVTKLDAKPAEIVQEVAGTVYKYISVTKQNIDDENVKAAAINFKVEKSWLSDNSIDKADIVLNRFTTQWDELDTSIASENDQYVHYSAVTPGFSYFTISAKAVVEELPAENVTEEAPAENVTEEAPAEEEVPKPDIMKVIIIIAIIAALTIYVMAWGGK